ncbi:MAG TPA: methyltransferase [Bryobacteraceae bacterium]|nr:methyltransferase [Bryobacteraceae bacterium]
MSQAAAAETHISPERILQTGLAFWSSKTLLSAIELGIFTELSRQPLTLAELQSKFGLHERGARDFFDALLALGFLSRQNGVYSNTPDTQLFLDKENPAYVGGILEMANARLYPFWANLTEALRTGLPQNEARDGSPSTFETLYSDPARLRTFLRGMTGISRGANLAIARLLPWDRYSTYADIGTAQGDLAVQVALQHPHLTGVGFDLPQTSAVFEEYARENGVNDRLRFQPGDFFKDALPNVDVILMGHILHDWGLETKKMLVRKAYEALPEGGTFAVYDSLIDDDRSRNAFGLLMSLNMLIETPDGFDYSGADCQGWLKEAGFRETRVEHLVGPDYVVIAVK